MVSRSRHRVVSKLDTEETGASDADRRNLSTEAAQNSGLFVAFEKLLISAV